MSGDFNAENWAMIIDNKSFTEYQSYIEQELEKWVKVYRKDEVVFITGTPSKRIRESALAHFRFVLHDQTLDERWLILKKVLTPDNSLN